MKLKQSLKLIALTAAIAASYSASAGGILKVAQSRDPGNWDPIDTFKIAWSSVGGHVFDGLLLRDEKLQLQPGLAEKWEVLEDGMRLRFYLRKGVSFHNGEPFNANAVKYTFDRLLGEEGKKGSQRSNYTSINNVKIIDDYTVDFEMNNPDPVMLTKLAGYGSMIVPPKYIEEKGEENFNMNPVGTGPFSMKSYQPGIGVELVKNPDYFAGAPKLDGIKYRFIKEDATRVAELQAGRIDVIHNLSSSSIPVVKKADNLKVVSVPGATIQSMQFNLKNGITKDVRVRQALNMAVDKQMIVDAFLAGYAKPIASLQGELSFGYDPELKGYKYDPVQAKKLLKEAGVKPGAKVTIDFRSNNGVIKEVSQALTGFFSAVGLKASVKPIENGVFLNETVPQGKTNELFQFGWGGWTFDFDNTAYLIYHTGERRNPYLSSKEMDELLEKQRKIVNQTERQKILRQVARLAHDNAYHLPLYNEDMVYAISDKVVNFIPAPDRRLRYVTTDLKD